MNGGIQAHAAIIDRVAVEYLIVHVICRTRPVEGFVHGGITRRAIALLAHQPARQPVSMLRVVDGTALFWPAGVTPRAAMVLSV